MSAARHRAAQPRALRGPEGAVGGANIRSPTPPAPPRGGLGCAQRYDRWALGSEKSVKMDVGRLDTPRFLGYLP